MSDIDGASEASKRRAHARQAVGRNAPLARDARTRLRPRLVPDQQQKTPSSEPVLGAELRAAREARGWSLRDVTQRSGINSGYLSLVERGQVRQPKPNVLRRLAEGYDEPFELLMTWAGYVEADPAGLSANQRRALSLLGPDPTTEELRALETILQMLRANRKATFAQVYTLRLSLEEQSDVKRSVRAVLKEADAVGRFPTPLDDIYSVADLVEAQEITLSLEDRRILRARFGEVAMRVWRRLQGVIDFRNDEVWVNPELHPMKQRYVQAHEAGHKILTWQRDTFAFLESGRQLRPDVKDQFERQANFAAIELLAQGGRLREEADDDNPPDLQTVKRLGAKYGISLQATARYVAENSRRECACAIAFKRDDGALSPYHLFCSASFEERMGWRSGRAPQLAIDAALCTKTMLEVRPPLQCADVNARIITVRLSVIDTPHSVIAFFGCRPSRFQRLAGGGQITRPSSSSVPYAGSRGTKPA